MKVREDYFRTDLEEGAKQIFDRYLSETNAHMHILSQGMNYLVTEEEHPIVYELREADDYTVEKAVLLEETVVEGMLGDDEVEEVRALYESLD